MSRVADVLADGHEPADGLARLELPATVEVITVDGRHLTVHIEHAERGSHPFEWRELTGETDDGRYWSASLDRIESAEHWHAGYIFDGDTLDVETVRRRTCEDCGSTDDITETEIDGNLQSLCGDCRAKWGSYLSSTYQGGRV